MDFRILGPLEAQRGGRPLALGGRKQRALLALLLLHANETVSADRLIDELWGERAPASARNSLQNLVSKLRRALGGPQTAQRIRTRAGGYVLELESGELDLDRFERLRAAGRDALARGDPATAASKLGAALGLWRGPVLSDIVFEPFARAAHARLEELRLAALEDRIDADLALSRHAEIVGEVEELVRDHPLRERLRGQLMLALYRSGRQAEALDAYRSARRTLVEQLGLEPSPTLRDLEGAILRQEPSLDAPGPADAAEPISAEGAGPTLVGRQPELEELGRGLDAAIGGHGRLFLLSGEPGIGKSRLADELASLAARRGAQVLVGRSWEAGGAPAYWPWVQAMRTYVKRRDPKALRRTLGASAPTLAQILPELREIFTDLAPPPPVEREGARLELFDAVCSLLKGAAADQAVVIILDDLHAADQPSLLLLRFAAAELAEEPILLLGAYRDVDPTVGEELSETLADLTRRPQTRLIPLSGLSERDVGSFIGAAAGVAPPERFVAAVHGRTEGNPLFIGELVRLLAAEGRLEDRGAIERRIPQGIHAVIERRLRRLSQECRRLLALASILGREFTAEGVARLSEPPEDGLLAALDEAFEARVIGEVPRLAGRLRFSHELVRDVLYGEIPPVRRAALHRRAGEALERAAGALEPDLAEVAHHFSLAGPACVERAVHYARRAGERARALLAYEEAGRLFQVALHGLEAGGDEAARCELLLSLGDAQARAGRGAEAKATFLRAAELARTGGTAEQLARAALGYGGRFVWARAGDDRRTVALLEDALRALPADDTVLRARALARLAGALRDQRSRERTSSLSKQAIAIARRIDDPATLAYALDGRFAATMWPENPEERLSLADELLELAEATGDRERVVQARYYRAGMTRLELGDILAVEDELDVIEAIAGELRQPAQQWIVVATRATLALFKGRFDEAERLMEDALALGRLAQTGDAVLSHRVQLFTLRWQRGEFDGLEEILERSIREYPARPMFRCMLALIHAEEERESDARRELDELGADRFAVLPLTNEWLFSMGFLAEVANWLEDRERASTIYELLRPYPDRNASTADYISTGSVSRSLGLAAATVQRWDEAGIHFDNALASNKRMGARPWVACTELDYGRMLLARGALGDRRRAEDHLADCVATCRRLGMKRCARHAAALEPVSRGGV